MADLIAIAKSCGAIDYSPPPMRAVRGLSFTYAQLDAFVDKVLEMSGLDSTGATPFGMGWLQAPDTAPEQSGWYCTKRIGWGGQIMGTTKLWWDRERQNWYASPESHSAALSQSRMWLQAPPGTTDSGEGK